LLAHSIIYSPTHRLTNKPRYSLCRAFERTFRVKIKDFTHSRA
jgi:hypothetical protein